MLSSRYIVQRKYPADLKGLGNTITETDVQL